MFAEKRPVQEIDLFIKNLSLNIPEMLMDLSGWKPSSSLSELPSFYFEQSITLNTPDPEKPFRTSADPLALVTSCLVRLLKLLRDRGENLYEPSTVTFRSAQPILSALSSLQYSDLSLPSDVHRTCFFSICTTSSFTFPLARERRLEQVLH